MNRIHIRHLIGALTGLAAALAVAIAGATAAFATTDPPPGPLSRYEPVAPAVPVHTHAAVTSGMAGWQIALIAVGAAILGALVAVLLERARTAGRHLPVPAA